MSSEWMDDDLDCYFCDKPIVGVARWVLVGSETQPAHGVCREEFVSGWDDRDWAEAGTNEEASEYVDAMLNVPEWY